MKKYIEILFYLIVLLLGIAVGRYLFPKETIKIQNAPIPTSRIITQTNTIIKYIPKQTEPQTGQKEKTDIEINSEKPTINVLVNNKPFQFDLLTGEQYKFKDGKIEFNQSTSLDLNLTLLKPERKIELGGYLSLDSFGGTLLIPKKDNGSYILMGGPHYDFKGWDAIFSITW
jgi:hypothetical protein